MADEPEELEPGDDLDLPDGNVWVWGIVEFCQRYKVEAIVTWGGETTCYVTGKGAVSLHELVKGKPGSKVTAITGGKK